MRMQRAIAVALAALGGLAAALPAADADKPEDRTVYSEDLSRSKERPEWSVPPLKLQSGWRPILLGPFGDGEATLTLTGLPSHERIRIRLDFGAFGSWESSVEKGTPRIWTAAIVGGPTLVCTSVQTRLLAAEGNTGWPGEFPVAPWANVEAPRRPAAPGVALSRPSVAYCSIETVLPHRAEDLKLRFAGLCNAGGFFYCAWGINRITVDVLGPPAALPAETLTKLWDELASVKPGVACKAMWSFAGAGDEARAFLRAKLEAAPKMKVSAADVKKWTSQIDADDFDTREMATRQLAAIGWPVRDALLNLLASDSPEVRGRAKLALREIADAVPMSVKDKRLVRAYRALQLLEWQNPSAKAIPLPGRYPAPASQPADRAASQPAEPARKQPSGEAAAGE